jgi:tripartite-type tricarboxylate transporter receptor subunit TctC
MQSHIVSHFLLVVALSVTSGATLAQGTTATGSNKPIRVIVPFGPGSAVDSQGRYFADQLGKVLNTSVYVENKPGANGALGLQALKSAPADGLTLAVVSPSLVVTPILSKNANYRVEDFRPVAGMSKGPIGFFVRSDSPFKTLSDALEAAKREKRPLAMGTYAGSYQIGAAWLSSLAGVPITNVSYRGGSQAVIDLIGGSLETMSADYLSMLPMVRDGKLRVLATASEKRLSDMPNVPTVNELHPGYVNYVWTGLVVRSDTPNEVVEKLSRAMATITKSVDTQDYLRKLGWEVLGHDAMAMKHFVDDENRRFKDVAKQASIEAQ